MKNILILTLTISSLILFFSNVSQGQTIENLDKKYGFRDAIFESNIVLYRDMEFVEREGDLTFYIRPNENLKVGDFPLESIVYVFFKGKLYLVTITTKGFSNSRGLLNALTLQYGEGHRKQNNSGIQEWRGKKTYLIYEEDADSNADVVMFSVPIHTIVEKEKAERAAKDL